jgi:hypothetical protein
MRDTKRSSSYSHAATSILRRMGTTFRRLRSYWIPQNEVRAEAWALGLRHGGEVLKGALAEVAGTQLSFRRTVLLRAVIRSENLLARSKAKARAR